MTGRRVPDCPARNKGLYLEEVEYMLMKYLAWMLIRGSIDKVVEVARFHATS